MASYGELSDYYSYAEFSQSIKERSLFDTGNTPGDKETFLTLMTLIFASVVMVAVGLKGPGGMLAALIMGGVVCTALSVAGTLPGNLLSCRSWFHCSSMLFPSFFCCALLLLSFRNVI